MDQDLDDNSRAGGVRGGEGGIRTLDTLASMPHFECGAFNHSATSPDRVQGWADEAARRVSGGT